MKMSTRLLNFTAIAFFVRQAQTALQGNLHKDSNKILSLHFVNPGSSYSYNKPVNFIKLFSSVSLFMYRQSSRNQKPVS